MLVAEAATPHPSPPALAPLKFDDGGVYDFVALKVVVDALADPANAVDSAGMATATIATNDTSIRSKRFISLNLSYDHIDVIVNS